MDKDFENHFYRVSHKKEQFLVYILDINITNILELNITEYKQKDI